MANDDKTPEEKLEFMKYAEEIGNISKTARECGFNRNDYLKFKKRYEIEGLEGLKDKRKHKKSKIKDYVVEEILRLAREMPANSSNEIHRIFSKKKDKEFHIGRTIIQTIMNKNGLGTIKARYEVHKKREEVDDTETEAESEIVEYELTEDHLEFVSKRVRDTYNLYYKKINSSDLSNAINLIYEKSAFPKATTFGRGTNEVLRENAVKKYIREFLENKR